jgi:uncharacterized cysteine cluster protein YcgN (CxxCxxCC family)
MSNLKMNKEENNQVNMCKIRCSVLEIRLKGCTCYEEYLAKKPKESLTEREKRYLIKN